MTSRTCIRRVVIAPLVAVSVAVLIAGNACCGCDEDGCANIWVCTSVVLSQITSCCGFGSGQATCSGGSWQVTCQEGGFCTEGGGPS